MNNFISAEEFLKQDEKVQKVLIDWWTPQTGDLIGIEREYIGESFNSIIRYDVKGVSEDNIFNCDSKEDLLNSLKYIPIGEQSEKAVLLLTVGQLIQFIEGKTYSKLELYLDCDNKYTIMLCRDTYFKYNTDKTDLLQALWQVAIQIAKELTNL